MEVLPSYQRVTRESDGETPPLHAPRPRREHRAQLLLARTTLLDEVSTQGGPAVHWERVGGVCVCWGAGGKG